MSQIGSSCQVEVKIKDVWSHDPVEDGHHTFNDGKPSNGYIHPYSLVDDHLLYKKNQNTWNLKFLGGKL